MKRQVLFIRSVQKELAEKAGSGIMDMMQLSRQAGLRAPVFRQDAGQFVQTLWRPEPVATGQVASPDKTLSGKTLNDLVAALASATGQVTGQVTVTMLALCGESRTAREIQLAVGIKHRETFLDNYLHPLLNAGWLERTIPNRPTSRLQKYRLTDKGRAWLKKAKP